ncbi:MAG: 23S rRNA (pseudouridine(1915)-N(3))-methyltransferase RlmH [Thermoplasmatales archaeon]|nr:23S rRNA (pseudouridine(1915)-N(3))-methyltransferase RlmH [Thermoplasmatales archaeon]
MIKIVCLGKLKEKFYVEAVEEYGKRLEKFFRLEIVETDEIKDLGDFNIFLDENGEQMSSIEFANFLKDIILKNKNVYFFIGSYKGFDEKENADFILSLSKMTFPYQLCRLVLIEQIYRAMTIIKGINYQK